MVWDHLREVSSEVFEDALDAGRVEVSIMDGESRELLEASAGDYELVAPEARLVRNGYVTHSVRDEALFLLTRQKRHFMHRTHNLLGSPLEV
jgi:hypothetical protein